MSRPSGGRWGQNFLTDRAVARRIAGHVEGAPVLEIGPGRGALTAPLLEACPRVAAIEIDERLVAELQETFEEPIARGRLTLARGDAAALDWTPLLEGLRDEGHATPHLAANLPYQAGTAIVLRYLETSAVGRRLDRAVVMLQLEVAERLTATPRTKPYGSLTVLAQATHAAHLLFKVGASSFRPRPQVTSAVVELSPRERPALDATTWRSGAAFVQRAFSRRRKQLAGVLAGTGELDREGWRRRLIELGHRPDSRAEELTPDELLALHAVPTEPAQ